MSLKEAMEYLGIGRTKLYWLTKEGKLSTVKIGKRILVDPADLHRFIEQSKE